MTIHGIAGSSVGRVDLSDEYYIGLEDPPIDGRKKVYTIVEDFERKPCETVFQVMCAVVFVMRQFDFSPFNAHVIGHFATTLVQQEVPYPDFVEKAAMQFRKIHNEGLPAFIPQKSSSQTEDLEIAAILEAMAKGGNTRIEGYLDILFTSYEKGIIESPMINWAVLQILRSTPVEYAPVPQLCNTPLPKPGWEEKDPWASRVAEITYICMNLPFDLERYAYLAPYIKALKNLTTSQCETTDIFIKKAEELILPDHGRSFGPLKKINREALKTLCAYQSGELPFENYRETLAEIRELTLQVLATIADLRFLFAHALPLDRGHVETWQSVMHQVLAKEGTMSQRRKAIFALETIPYVKDPDVAEDHREFLEKIKLALLQVVIGQRKRKVIEK